MDPMNSRDVLPKNVPGVGWGRMEWVGSCMGWGWGGVSHVGVGWGGSCWDGVGWGGSCRGGVGWVM